MGMGEPLANLDRLLPALGEATSPTGLGISHRRITISTVGLPPAMRSAGRTRRPLSTGRFAARPERSSCAIELVPVNKNIGLDAILAAADRYFEVSGRRLTFEYVLLGGLNDQPQHAHKLAALLRGRTALLNVIPYNPVAGLAVSERRRKNAVRAVPRDPATRPASTCKSASAKGTRSTPPAANCGGWPSWKSRQSRENLGISTGLVNPIPDLLKPVLPRLFAIGPAGYDYGTNCAKSRKIAHGIWCPRPTVAQTASNRKRDLACPTEIVRGGSSAWRALSLDRPSLQR